MPGDARAPQLVAELIHTARLVLHPLRPEHAGALEPVLDDASLHRFTGGEPVRGDALRERLERQASGWSADGRDRWLNWTVRERGSQTTIGTVQATVTVEDGVPVATLAWVVGAAFQGRGHAKESAAAVRGWLRQAGVDRARAHIHPDHRASAGVARAAGLIPTGEIVDGERRWVTPGPLELYLAAFDARCAQRRRPGDETLTVPGLRGLITGAGGPLTLVASDDRAHDRLDALLTDARTGYVNVLAVAPRCAALLCGLREWTAKQLTPMVGADLRTVPELPLPAGLDLRAISLAPRPAGSAVTLERAVAAVRNADPDVSWSAAELCAYLRGHRAPIELFAAIDSGGTVRATSGVQLAAGYATVFFVGTDPAWRGQGIGTAMTAAALRRARAAGASRACLDATAAGESIYARLGFTAVGPMTRFYRRA